MALEQHQIVAVDQFLFIDVTEFLLDLSRRRAHNTARLAGAVIDQAACNFKPRLVATTNHFTAFKFAADGADADRQQAAARFAQRLYRAGVECETQ